MRILLIILSLITIITPSCLQTDRKTTDAPTQVTNLNEQEIRKMFIDTVSKMHDYWPGIFTFFRTYYPSVDIADRNNQDLQLTYAFEEEFFDKSSFDSSRQVLRLIFQPSFSNPWCVKLELKNGKTYLTTKLLNGEGGYYSGYLTKSLTQVLPDSLVKTYIQKLNELNFWQIKNDTNCEGYDGIRIYYDAIDHNRIARVYRWTPLACEDSVTVNLGRIAESLSRISSVNILR